MNECWTAARFAVLTGGLLFLAPLAPAQAGRACTGSDYCNVCSTCSSCRYCTSGGSCGVCRRTSPGRSRGGGTYRPPPPSLQPPPPAAPRVLFETPKRQASLQLGVSQVTCSRAIDGDSIEVTKNQFPFEVRIVGIDAPELDQPFGDLARKAVEAVCVGKQVTVNVSDHDQYGRAIAEVTLPGSFSLGRTLVASGGAWWYRSYSHDLELGRLEAEARGKKKGLWSQPNPVPPWQWRDLAASSRKE